MKKIYSILCGLTLLLLGYSCQDSFVEDSSVKLAGNQIQMRFLTVPGMIGNIQLYVFSIVGATDTVLFQQPPLVTGSALSNPVTLTLPPGNYTIAALANVDSRVATFTTGVTHISDVLLAITASTSFSGNYEEAGMWFWGINKQVRVGIDYTAVVELKRLVAKAVITYTHADPYLTSLKMSIDGVARQAFLNGNFSAIQGQGVSVLKNITAINTKANVDSLILLPTVNATSRVKLDIVRTQAGVAQPFSYSSLLSVPIKSNYITNIQINGGEQSSVNVSETVWDTAASTIILDQAPSASIGLALGDFTQVENDTTHLQAVDLLITVNGGIADNYKDIFTFTINKTSPNSGSYTNTIAMQVVNGKLMTQTPIPLSRGVYQLTNYKLTDTQGVLPDPNNKATAITFTVGLSYQTVNVTLDGRQETDNALLLQACTLIHNTAPVGSIFPGTAYYNTRPLPVTYPPAGASITKSSWYVNTNNYVMMIPINGEWRVYSIVYRGFISKLTGMLPSQLGQLLQTTYLDLQSNVLTGTIPASFSNLSLLNTLVLIKNNLTGNINNLGPLTKLTRLSLENNIFSGTMNTGLAGSKQTLSYLSVNNNTFSGDLNTLFNTANGNLTIASIFLQQNLFTGYLPPFNVAITSGVAQCDFRYNGFTCIPNAIPTNVIGGRCNPQNGNVTVTCRY